MALTAEHFKRIRAAEAELKAAYAAAAAELDDSACVLVTEGATVSVWAKMRGAFRELKQAEPVRVS